MKGELLKTGQVLVADSGDYTVLKRIGLTGATARVYLVERLRDQRRFALKCMQPGLSPEMQAVFHNEMINLQRLRSAEEAFGTRHIPRITESSDLDQPKTRELLRFLGNPFIIMDYAEGADIPSMLMEHPVLREPPALEIIRQFSEVLAVIHGHGFAYTDMKPGNLIWNAGERHLMVIDWNVISEGRLEADAPRDRLRAAAYLFQMLTGFSIALDETSTGPVNQKFRLLDNFKALSRGTRSILIKAFHPDHRARHGEDGSQEQCSRALLKALGEHVERFNMPPQRLIEKGKSALDYRQWAEAWEYFDLADRLSDIEADPGQFAQLRQDLEKARSEARKLGRNSFRSGISRLNNGLFKEALEDFQGAMQDDPYDEEPRLYAILSNFAVQVGEETFSAYRQPLEDCISALLKGQTGLAEDALKRLPAETRHMGATASLEAEIITRKALGEGRRLLKEDRLEEARESFRAAYQQRDHLMYVEPLEENLGSMRQLYDNVEELKKLFEEGAAYFEADRYHEAAWTFWKAHQISRGSPLAAHRYQAASRFDAVQKLLAAGEAELAMEECNRAAGRFSGESRFAHLEKQVIRARCEQLRQLADRYYKEHDYKTALACIGELLKLNPRDAAGILKKEAIQKEIDGGFKETIRQLSLQLQKDISIETCEDILRTVEQLGIGHLSEARKFIGEVKQIIESIKRLGLQLDHAGDSGNLAKQLELLEQAAAKNWRLPQGNPTQLMEAIKPRLRKQTLSEIRDHIVHARPSEARPLIRRLLETPLPPEQEARLNELLDAANQLENHLNTLKYIQGKKNLFSTQAEGYPLVMLRLEKQLLQTLMRIRQVRPLPQAPPEVPQYPQLLQTFLSGIGEYIARAFSEAEAALHRRDISAGNAITPQVDEAAAVFIEFQPGADEPARDWLTRNRSFKNLFQFMEHEPPPFDWTADVHHILTKCRRMSSHPQVQELLSTLDTIPPHELPENPGHLDRLASLAPGCPVACWLHRALEQQVNIIRAWNIMDRAPEEAGPFIDGTFKSSEQKIFLPTMELLDQVRRFLEHQGPEDQPPRLYMETLRNSLEKGRQLLTQLESFPRFRRGQTAQRLENHVHMLEQRWAHTRETLARGYIDGIETLLRELQATLDDPLLRHRLEKKADAEIQRLEEVDPAEAGRYRPQVSALLQQLLETAQGAAGEEPEQLKRLLELQLRVCDQTRGMDRFDIAAILRPFREDPHFKEVITLYTRRHENMLYKFNKLEPRPIKKHVKELLALREGFGPFPEIDLALRRINHECLRQKSHDAFDRLRKELPVARNRGDWKQLEQIAAEIQPDLLNKKQRDELPPIKDEIRNRLLLRASLNRRDFLEFLTFGKDRPDRDTHRWVKALEWSVFQKQGGIKPDPDALAALYDAEQSWLERRRVNLDAFLALRRIKWLIQRLYPTPSPARTGKNEEAS